MAENTEYTCFYCPKCGTEVAGWGLDLSEFDPDNFCECSEED